MKRESTSTRAIATSKGKKRAQSSLESSSKSLGGVWSVIAMEDIPVGAFVIEIVGQYVSGGTLRVPVRRGAYF